jgi:hypothetical protein
MTPKTTPDNEQRAAVATTALAIFKRRHNCIPAKREDLLPEWNELLDRLKKRMAYKTNKKQKPVGERSEQIIGCVGASKKPLTLDGIRKRIEKATGKSQRSKVKGQKSR